MDPDVDPVPRMRSSDYRIRMRIREAQKHTDPPDQEHLYLYIFINLQRSSKKSQTGRNRGFFTIFLDDGKIRSRIRTCD